MTRQERREILHNKKKNKIRQHGKGLAQHYKNVTIKKALKEV